MRFSRIPMVAAGCALLAGGAWFAMAKNSPSEPVSAPPPENLASAVVGGGCFWCTEAVFERVPGVHAVVSGYAGGSTPNPTYKQISEGDTGHAEVIDIRYDPTKVTYRELIDLFWDAHDPTTLNRQGADVGTQYRSIILYRTEQEKADAEASIKAIQPRFKSPIVTELAPLKEFYPAEAYHQDFYANNPNYGYSLAVIEPKVRKLQKSKKIKE
jgi:peptide-methionine (S)-S-oxide reductase